MSFFLDYGYLKINSKVLSSFQKRILNTFSGTLFNNHKIQYDSCALPIDRSNVYFFYPRPLTVMKKLISTLIR